MADGFSDVFYTSTDGLRLHARVYGAHLDAAPVVCLPGLTRNARDFHDLAVYLSGEAKVRRKVVVFDYRGRGLSAYDPEWKHYNIVVEAGDVLAGLDAIGVEAGHFIGTSRGGLILHLLAGMRPTALKSVVLNDIGPVLEAEGLAAIRSYLEGAAKPATLAEAIALQKKVHGPAFPALSEADWERFVKAIYRFEDGVPTLDFDPALLNTLTSFDPARPMPEMWPQFQGFDPIPLLVIRGENSTLLSTATLSEMAKRHPDCETITVAGQGHAPFLETAALPRALAAFFADADAK